MTLQMRSGTNKLRIGVLAVLVSVSLGMSAFAGVTVLDNLRQGGMWRAQATQQDGDILPARPTNFANDIQKQAVTELKDFGQWLSANNAKGFIGELGWPSDNSSKDWNSVANAWYQESYYHDLWVTAWAAGSWWSGYPLSIYDHTDQARSLDAADVQAEVVGRYKTISNHRYGINLAGMEFGTDKPGFSSANPGVPGQDYFYEPASSYKYLADQGMTLIRMPFTWERIQPTLGGELEPREVAAIKEQLDAAQANGLQVILDLHNYGAYTTADGKHVLGDGTLTHQQLVDVWQKLSTAFKDHPAIAAYGIMNEPHNLPAGGYSSPTKNWEAASQTVVTALRDSGDTTLVMIAGYDWSSLARWDQNHPAGWIQDPASAFRYEAHHYWDSDGSGAYQRSFDDELEKR